MLAPWLTLALGYTSTAMLPRGALLPSAGTPARAVRCGALSMGEDTLSCDVRKLPQSAVALDFKVPAPVSNEIHMKVLNKLAKQTRLTGFREGKAPPQAVIAKLGMQKVKEATVEQIVEVGLAQSGVTGKLNTVGDVRLPEELSALAKRYKPGDALDFSVEVDIYPEIPLTQEQYTGLAVESERVEFNQEAYDNALLKLRHQHADMVDAEAGAASAEGEQLVVNMNGFLADNDGGKGEALPNVAGGDGVDVPLTPGKFMPGLVEGLVGVKAGETREIKVQFPPRSSAPQLAGKEAIFEVECLKVQRRVLPEVGDDFAEKVMSGMDWNALDAKLREGVEEDRLNRQRGNTHKALQKALVAALPDDFEVPETLVEQVTKERFAGMLSDMREQGTTDEQLKEIITQENFERYTKISRPSTLSQIKCDFALKAIGQQQALQVPQSEVDDELMSLQAQTIQRGEKFKESEVRPKIEATKEKEMVLDWLTEKAEVTIVEPKEVDPEAELGISAEELAKEMGSDAAAAPPPPPPPPPPAAGSGSSSPGPAAPGGYEWGQTF